MPSILAKVSMGTQRRRVVGCIAWLGLSGGVRGGPHVNAVNAVGLVR
jgi:hypothetical protein